MARQPGSSAGDRRRSALLFRSERFFVVGAWTLAFLLLLGMRAPGLWLPLERDEGAYGLVALLWQRGWLPYRDVFDHKPPLIYLLYMPAVVWNTPLPFSLRLWSSLLFVLQLPLLYSVGRQAFGSAGAALSVLLYAVAGSAFSLQGLMLNTEQALVLPSLAALWVLLRGMSDTRLRWPLLYGVGLGATLLIKPTGVPFLFPLVLLQRPGARSARIVGLAVAGAGLGIAVLPVVAYWGAAGALDELVFALLTYNQRYAAESVARWSTAGLVNMLAPYGPLLVCAAGGVALARQRVRRRQRIAIVGWTAAFALAAVLSFRPYTHYYYPVLAGLALLAGPPITARIREIWSVPSTKRRLVALGGPLVLLGLLLLPLLIDNARLLRLRPTAQAAALYGDDGARYFGPAEMVAAFVATRTTPAQPILVWAAEPQIYLLARREPSSRYIYDYPLGFVPGARTELAEALRQRPPAVIVTYHGFQPQGWHDLQQRMGLRLEATIGGYDVWTAD